MRLQVVEPGGVHRRAALGGDHRVGAAVLDPHQRVLAGLAALRATGGEDDDGLGAAWQGVALLATGALVQLHLVPHPLLRTRLVLTFQRRSPALSRWGAQRALESGAPPY